MSDLPATPWRRLAAAVYDGLLLLGIWLAVLLIDVIARGFFDAPRNLPLLRVYLFTVGLLFFGWFWTHGGQTLGMRAWRLVVSRDDGRALSWPVAALRYTAMLACWAIALLPLFARLPPLGTSASGFWLVLGAGGLSVSALIAMVVDQRRRLPPDWLSGCVVTQQPPKA